MNSFIVNVVAMILISAGVSGLVFRSYIYNKKVQDNNNGPFDIAIIEKRFYIISVWAGITFIVFGIVMMLLL